MDATVTVTADEAYQNGGQESSEEATVSAMGFDQLSVSMAGEARCNGDEISGAQRRCKNCHEPLRDADEDENGQPVSLDPGTGDPTFCPDSDDAGPHVPEWVPGSFANSARVVVSDDDAVTVTISVGDPRGAFAMTVYRRESTGELYLSLPDPSDGLPHMRLTRIRDGYFKIGY